MGGAAKGRDAPGGSLLYLTPQSRRLAAGPSGGVEVKACYRIGLLVALALSWTLAPSGTLRANPLPEAAIFVHVQPPDPGSPPLASCAEIQQYTSATGALEFDLYFKCFVCGPGTTLSGFRMSFVWDPDWIWQGFALPPGAEGSVSVNGAMATAELSWPDCPVMDNEVTLLLRCFVEVTGPGSVDASAAPGWVDIACPPMPTPLQSWLVGARAGVVCDYCWTDCGFDAVCCPSTPTPLLALAVPRGELVVETMDYFAMGGLWPCPLDASGSETWMGVSAESTGEGSYQVTLTVDTGPLEPGHYAGWVRGESEGVACTRVELEVLLPTDVPEGPPPPSFGRIKSFY